MMKYCSCLFLFLFFSASVSAQKVSGDMVRKYFPEFKVRQLHLYPALQNETSLVFEDQTFEGKKISNDVIGQLKMPTTDSLSYYAICQIPLNDHISFLILLKKSPTKETTILGYKYNRDNEKIEEKFILSQYRHLESAYESLTNSWLKDFDNDGDTDQIIQTDLRDFEFPTEESGNISNTQTIYYKCNGDSLTYDWVPPITMDLKMQK